MGCNQSWGLLTVAIIGAILAILGGILIPVGNHLIEKRIKKEVVIEKGTMAYKSWIVPGSPVYRQFWFFDVENPEDVMENGSAPKLKQKGPYTYRMNYMPKENIIVHDDATLSYLKPNIIVFQPDMSVGPESDTVTTLNFAVACAPALYKNGLIQILMNIWIKLSNSKFLQTRTVKELLWGYEDPFLKKTPFVKMDKVVGIFNPYNGTFDGPYRIYSGKDDISKKGIILTYKNSRTLPYWKSYCNMVNGTDGTSFHPFVSKSEQLYVFFPDLCRSMYATFDREQTVKGIPLYRFIGPPSVFASMQINPNNTCFCTDWKISENCSLTGVLDISSCKEGKPAFITFPHFLHGSEELFHFVEGMEPNVKEHTTFLYVEPLTGFNLGFEKKVQVNILVRPNSKIRVLKNVKHSFMFPVLWLNETAIISDEKAKLFRSRVTNRIKLLHLIQMALMISGSVVFLGFLIAFFTCKWKSSKLPAK